MTDPTTTSGAGSTAARYDQAVAGANGMPALAASVAAQDAAVLAQAGPPPDEDEPDTRQLRELPFLGFVDFDRKNDIRSVLQQLELGNLYGAARLAEAMLRDYAVNSALTTRVNGLLGADTTFRAGASDVKSKGLVALLEDGEETPGLWRQIAPTAELSELLRWGLLLGVGIAEIVWDTETHRKLLGQHGAINGVPAEVYEEERGLWIPRLKVWHPQSLYWQWDTSHPDTGYYKVITAAGTLTVTPGDGRWVLYTPYGYRRAWLRGLMRPLADLYLSHGWVNRDWDRYDEVHGLPTRVILVPADAQVADKNRVRSQVKNIGSEAVLDLPQPKDGKAGWDYKLVEATARTWDAFKDRLQKVEDAIDTLILGHPRSSDTKSGLVAAKQAAADIREEEQAFDATTLSDCLHAQLLRPFTRYNVGDADLAPRLDYDVGPPEDVAAKADTFAKVAQGVSAIATATQYLNVPIDIAQVLEENGQPVLPQGKQLETKAPPAPPSAPAPAAKPLQGAAPAPAVKPAAAVGTPTKKPAPPTPAAAEPVQSRADAGLHQAHSEALERRAGAVQAKAESPIVERRPWHGLTVAVENAPGSVRKWGAGPNDETWMRAPYGFIEDHTGADGEEVDCYLGPDPSAKFVYVVHQMQAGDPTKYDEDKCFLDFATADSAKAAYVAHRNDGERCFGGMSAIPVEAFLRKLKRREGTGRIRAKGTGVGVALDAADGAGHWITIDGTHVYVKGGVIVKGPGHMVGHAPESIPSPPSHAAPAPSNSPAPKPAAPKEAPAPEKKQPEPEKPAESGEFKPKSVSNPDKWGHQHFDGWVHGLPSDEKAAVDKYISRDDPGNPTGFIKINGDLRKSGGTKTSAVTKNLDSALRRSPGAPHDVVLYRGMKGTPEIEAALKPGATFTDHGYMSTSVGAPVRALAHNIKFKINAPKGTKGAYVSASDKAVSGNDEFLLPRGTSLRIDKVTKRRWGYEVTASVVSK